jgi:hypothetical protein
MNAVMDMTAPVLAWLDSHRTLLAVLGGVSVLTFFGTLVVIPILVVRLPADYFTAEKRPPPGPWARRPPVRRLARLLKNLAGIVFIVTGLAMLVLPGQGLLTILIGVTLIDFPGKRNLEKRLIAQPTVLRAVNWMRRRGNRPALQVNSTESRKSRVGRSATASISRRTGVR